MTTNRRVAFNTLVRATPERVFDAVATAEGLGAWFTKGASVDASPGGSIRFRWENWGPDRYTGENRGPILEARRPERFVFRWKVDSGSCQTTVEINFEPHQAGTLVRLVEHGYEDSPEGTQDMLNRASGWGSALTLMNSTWSTASRTEREEWQPGRASQQTRFVALPCRRPLALVAPVAQQGATVPLALASTEVLVVHLRRGRGRRSLETEDPTERPHRPDRDVAESLNREPANYAHPPVSIG